MQCYQATLPIEIKCNQATHGPVSELACSLPQDGKAVTTGNGTHLTERSVDGSVKLIPVDEVKVLAVPGRAGNNSPLAPVVLETSDDDDHQKWQFEETETDYGVIQSNLGSDLVMTVHGGHGNRGTVIDIYTRPPYESYNQLWRREYLSDGTFRLISKLGNHVQLTMKVKSYEFTNI